MHDPWDGDWQSDSNRTRILLGMPLDAKPYTSKPGVLIRGVPDSPRMRDILDVGIYWRKKNHCKKSKIPMYADLSQNVLRLPYSLKISAFAQHSIVFDYTHGKVIEVEET